MDWIQLKIDTDDCHAEQLSELMMAQGALSISYEDGKDTPIYEPNLGEMPMWDHTVVSALFDGDKDIASIIEILKQSPFLGANFNHKIEVIEDKDWQREWMDNFHPIQFGKRLWICPSWYQPPEPQAVNVMLDPGLAFGSGTHPTTALCLQWLDGLDLAEKHLIDYGCGSGILAVAALKLGARKATGIDIDHQAVTAAKANAQRNDVIDKLELYLADEQPQNLQGDVLIANILAEPLRQLAPFIASKLLAGGIIALSGLLEEQTADIMKCYQQWFDFEEPLYQQEWCCLTGVRKEN